VVPQAPFIDLAAANAVAAVWCTQVNALKQMVELMRSHKTAANRETTSPGPIPHSREQTSTFNGGGWNLHRSVQPAIWGWRRDLCFAHAAIFHHALIGMSVGSSHGRRSACRSRLSS
jgi:hypothetical protein